MLACLASSAVRMSASINRESLSGQRLGQETHDRRSSLGFHADDDAVGLKGVPKRRPLAEEFRIGGEIEPLAASLAGEGQPKPVRRARRPGGLLDHNHLVASVTGDLDGAPFHGQKVDLSVCSGRRPYADEDDRCVVDGVARFGSKRQATGGHLPREGFLESGLVKRVDPSVEGAITLPVDVVAVTSWPIVASATQVTRPTWPVPMTATFTAPQSCE